MRRYTLPLLLATLGLVACTDPPYAKAPQKDDGVPANSLSETRLSGSEPKKAAPPEKTPDESKDPTQPLLTKVGENPPDTTEEPSKDPKDPKKKDPKTANKKGPVTKAECAETMDKYLDLEIGANPKLQGVGPDVIAQAKQMARQQHGESPCTATRAQYNCAMGATSTAGWQKCMK